MSFLRKITKDDAKTSKLVVAAIYLSVIFGILAFGFFVEKTAYTGREAPLQTGLPAVGISK